MTKNNQNIIIANNEIAIKAFKTIINSNKSCLISGNPFTGKSTLKKSIIDLTNKKCLVLAPNEREAIRTNEVSIQLFFNLVDIILDSNFEITNHLNYSKEHIDFIKSIELIIIEDISLLSSKNLDIINLICQKIRENSNPMGGIQLLIVGDLFESSPELNEKELNEIKKIWKSQFFFDAKCYDSLNIESFFLKETYNKNEDAHYSNFLNLIKENKLKNSELTNFNNLHFNYDGIENEQKIIITSCNKKADEINKIKSSLLPPCKYSLFALISSDMDRNLLPVKSIIDIKSGTKVILINNGKMDVEYENGTIGIFIKEENEFIEVETEKYGLLKIAQQEWCNYKYEVDFYDGEFIKVPVSTIIQYPIKLGWAISIHESKGMKFDDIHFENKDDSTLIDEYVYRVYSRCNGKISKFSMTIPFRESDINSEISKLEFYQNKVI